MGGVPIRNRSGKAHRAFCWSPLVYILKCPNWQLLRQPHMIIGCNCQSGINLWLWQSWITALQHLRRHSSRAAGSGCLRRLPARMAAGDKRFPPPQCFCQLPLASSARCFSRDSLPPPSPRATWCLTLIPFSAFNIRIETTGAGLPATIPPVSSEGSGGSVQDTRRDSSLEYSGPVAKARPRLSLIALAEESENDLVSGCPTTMSLLTGSTQCGHCTCIYCISLL